jgi:hypothetical protein
MDVLMLCAIDRRSVQLVDVPGMQNLRLFPTLARDNKFSDRLICDVLRDSRCRQHK